MRMIVAMSLALMLLVAPAAAWEQYMIGSWTIYVSRDPVAVDAECRVRFVQSGYQAPTGGLRGCTDFDHQTVITANDLGVIFHEMCHVLLATRSHTLCPVPGTESAESRRGRR